MRSVRWGILSTGTIAKSFAETAGKMGGVEIRAVASRSMDKAEAFAAAYGIPTFYDSYEALAADPQVDIVYIATPHSRHAEDMKLMIRAGKHILCEKSFTTDAGQAEEIFALAKEKGVFVMEAFWTKFCPVYREIERVIASGEIGEITAVTAQYGYTTARQARKFDPELAGGTLLDIGVYAIGFACMTMGYEPDEIISRMTLNEQGTDAVDAIILRKGNTVGSLLTAIGAQIPTHGAIYGTKGRIDVPEFKNPQRVTVYQNGCGAQVIECPFEVNGFEYEIREAEQCVREGRLASRVMTPEQSVAVMRIMDTVRAQSSLVFPFER